MKKHIEIFKRSLSEDSNYKQFILQSSKGSNVVSNVFVSENSIVVLDVNIDKDQPQYRIEFYYPESKILRYKWKTFVSVMEERFSAISKFFAHDFKADIVDSMLTYIFGKDYAIFLYNKEANMNTLDLNTPFTEKEVSAFIAQGSDEDHSQIRVRKNGIAFISTPDTEGVGNQNRTKDSHLFCLETFCAGNGYVGLDASLDKDWVSELTRNLQRYFANPDLCEQEK